MRRYGVTLVLILSVSGGAWLRADDDVPALVRRLEDPVQRESAARSILDAGGAALPHLEAVLFQASGASELLRREVLALLPRFGDPGIGPL
ncbi:MAG: hypothetical protein FJ098_15775, partial [Deltaproteobacteria bacterium]|nr:hypothetical protein [Deltaproteobacteria bacterium]